MGNLKYLTIITGILSFYLFFFIEGKLIAFFCLKELWIAVPSMILSIVILIPGLFILNIIIYIMLDELKLLGKEDKK